MTAMTLLQARARTAQHLDDPSNTRWDATVLDEALANALDLAQEEYEGDHYIQTVEVATTAADHQADLSSYDPVRVDGVSIQSGSRWFPLPRVELRHREYNSQTAHTLQIDLVQKYALPTNTAHPLIGAGATAAPEWKGMEHLICLDAAMMLSAKDMDPGQMAVLERLAERQRQRVMQSGPVCDVTDFPAPPILYSEAYVWTWDGVNQKVGLQRRTWWP